MDPITKIVLWVGTSIAFMRENENATGWHPCSLEAIALQLLAERTQTPMLKVQRQHLRRGKVSHEDGAGAVGVSSELNVVSGQEDGAVAGGGEWGGGMGGWWVVGGVHSVEC